MDSSFISKWINTRLLWHEQLLNSFFWDQDSVIVTKTTFFLSLEITTARVTVTCSTLLFLLWLRQLLWHDQLSSLVLSLCGDQNNVTVTWTIPFFLKGSIQGYCDMNNFLHSFPRDQDRVIVTRTTSFVLFGSSQLGLPWHAPLSSFFYD